MDLSGGVWGCVDVTDFYSNRVFFVGSRESSNVIFVFIQLHTVFECPYETFNEEKINKSKCKSGISKVHQIEKKIKCDHTYEVNIPFDVNSELIVF